MITAISKCGNGVGLRIPQPFLWQLGLEVGDRVEFKVALANKNARMARSFTKKQ